MFTELILAAVLHAAPTAEEVRVETRALLQSICGWQCDVVDVTIKTKPATPQGAVAPGFDDAPAQRQVPSAIDLTLLLDSKLTPAFRTFVAERVRARIGEMGLPVTINPRVMPFPDRPSPPAEPEALRPQEPPPQPVPQAPAPQPIIVNPPAPPPPVAEKPDPFAALVLALIQALPLLLLGGLLAWTVLRVLRRYESFLGPAAPIEEEAAKTGATTAAAPGPVKIAPPNAAGLIEALKNSRAATRRVFRTLIAQNELDTVAHSVATLGDFVLADLPHDPLVRSALPSLGRRASEILRQPIGEDARDEALRRVNAELIADRLAHPGEEVRPEFGLLLGFGPEAFAALASRLPARSRTLLLRYAPSHLVDSYLRGLGTKDHAETARSLLTAPPADPAEITALIGAIEGERPAALLAGEEADRIVDVIDTLPANEQDQMLEALAASRPDFVRRNLGQLPVESALLRVGDASIVRAFAEVPLEEWVAYLRAAPEAIRNRALHLCPARLKEALHEELGLRVVADPTRASEARRRIVRAAISAHGPLSNGAAERPLATREREVQNDPGRREVKR